MADIGRCQEILLVLAEKQGYLTFDDILEQADAFSLSVAEVDALSEAIHLRDIIVYESAPTADYQQEDEEIFDYSRTDYEMLFAEILELAPQLSTLIDAIKSYPPPQYGEITQLKRQAAEGNQFAFNRLVTLYMRNVLKIALSMTKQYELELEDAISSGFIGLMSAIDKYDPAGFSPFHSYASRWIQQGIQRDCNPCWMDYYFPAHYQEKMVRVIRKYSQYAVDEGADLVHYYEAVKRISYELELSEDDVDKALRDGLIQKYGKRSIEELVVSEYAWEGTTPRELMEDDEDSLNTVFHNALRDTMEEILNTLTPKEKMVVQLRNGIGEPHPMTLEGVGSLLHVTRERVRQIEKKSMGHLRKLANEERLADFLYV